MRTIATTCLVVLAAATFLTACGSTEESGDAVGPGTLLQLDGTITGAEAGTESFSVTPKAEGEQAITFAYGPEVAPAEILAMSAAGTVVRVSYRPTTDDPVAASVKAAPEYGEDVLEYTGTIELIDKERIVINGPSGERSFDIRDADGEAFDQPHLKDHKDEGSKVKVYFRDAGDGLLTGLGYEDA
jgi:hypothetical protein